MISHQLAHRGFKQLKCKGFDRRSGGDAVMGSRWRRSR
ncbi:hypothetical protein OROGR_032702 [Orobanche gracilis]